MRDSVSSAAATASRCTSPVELFAYFVKTGRRIEPGGSWFEAIASYSGLAFSATCLGRARALSNLRLGGPSYRAKLKAVAGRSKIMRSDRNARFGIRTVVLQIAPPVAGTWNDTLIVAAGCKGAIESGF